MRTESDDETFELQFLRFVGTAQVLALSLASGEPSLPLVARLLARVIPVPRASAEFLLVRSLLVDYAARAVGAAPPRLARLWPLITQQPGDGNLATTFVRCLDAASGDGEFCRVSRPAQRARHAMTVIAARCAEPALSARAVAAEVGVSEEYLRKLLHRHYRCTFRVALRHARIDAARSMLEGTTAQIKAIAADVGYTSTSQFDRDFRCEWHTTPGEYRRAQVTIR